MAVFLPNVPRDGAAAFYGRLNLHTNAPEDLIQQAARAGMDIASMKDRLERIYHSGRHY